MKIEPKMISIRELVEGYEDMGDEGVVAYGGRLDVRPPYQREFIYKKEQRDAVIDTINNNYPLNVMYWAVREDGGFEIIDGQQRTISVCQYVKNDFSHNGMYFDNLQKDEQDKILDYELTVYWCSGTDSEKLKWFRTINIAGEELTAQELRNAVYHGPWVSHAKSYFSKRGCHAYAIASDYVSGSTIRQEYLETAIKWISRGRIDEYMSERHHEQNANELWLYFQTVVNWVKATFKVTRKKEMKSVDWGSLYNEYKDAQLDTDKIEEETKRLLDDDDVTKKSGIYPYILTRDEKHLSIRTFLDSTKRKVYERQGGKCATCKERFDIADMEADHITPWREGGKTTEENCQMLCKTDNRRKGAK